MGPQAQLAEHASTTSTPAMSASSSSDLPRRPKRRVLLFKTPSPDIQSDPYTSALASTSYKATFIPVLEERYTVDELVPIIAAQAGSQDDRDGGDGEAGRDAKGRGAYQEVSRNGLGSDTRGCSRALRSWEGVVITSRRGAEGWIRAVKSHLESIEGARTISRKGKERAHAGESSEEQPRIGCEPMHAEVGDSEEDAEGLEVGWAGVPLYTVGTASTEQLTHSGLPTRYIPRLPVYPHGQPVLDPDHIPNLQHNQSENPISCSSAIPTPPKSASVLTPLILDAPPLDGRSHKPYLLIRGDKSLEYIPDQLRAHGREFKEVVVYSTSPKPDVRQNLNEIAVQLQGPGSEGYSGNLKRRGAAEGVDRGPTKGWLAFFSPSGVDVALSAMTGLTHNGEKTFDGGPQGATGDNEFFGRSKMPGPWKDWRIFAIGETTRRYLEDERGLKVDAMADRPDAEGLAQAISAADGADVK
ncbi:hypothetical protein IAU59_001113 [Kwoniella sp. CBS 9459]